MSLPSHGQAVKDHKALLFVGTNCDSLVLRTMRSGNRQSPIVTGLAITRLGKTHNEIANKDICVMGNTERRDSHLLAQTKEWSSSSGVAVKESMICTGLDKERVNSIKECEE